MVDDNVTVRVAVRIRPQTPREIIDMCQICTSVTPGEQQVTLSHDKAFTYNHVFDTHAQQDEIYNTCIASLVEASLEGYNATVLAYGQTGSGKTYTMGTGFDVVAQEEQSGIIPKAINHLFNAIHKRIETVRSSGEMPPEFKVSVQFMELYNEEVIDLFNLTCNKEKSYRIHEDQYGNINICGITHKVVSSSYEALQHLRLGALSRTTASTKMNNQSSRSHAIYTLHISQQRITKLKNTNQERQHSHMELEMLTSKFHFVDLAGSERLKRTGATGERAKESIAINCGLLALGNVISALGDRSKRAAHVPYRDSKLTRLLQDSLGGNCQTVMIACISPSDRDFMETLNTLKYANRALNIRNKVIPNYDKNSSIIQQMRQQIAQLQQELLEYKQGIRMIGQDGSEVVSDLFCENTMLLYEITQLRIRVKAMQETIDVLTMKTSNLLSEKATKTWIGAENTSDSIACKIQIYLKQIEELKVKLLETNNICEQLQKQVNRTAFDHQMVMNNDEHVSVLDRAKESVEVERQHILQLSTAKTHKSSDNDSVASESYDLIESRDIENNNLTVSSEQLVKNELRNITKGIDIKQRLIEELELSQRRMHMMREQYESKLQLLQQRICNTQEERDEILRTYSSTTNNTGILVDTNADKIKRIKEDYSRKLNDLQKEVRRLQIAQRDHARLLRNQYQYEVQIRSYRNEVVEMKRTKVKLINRLKRESQRHKNAEQLRIREIAHLKNESRRNANLIKSMEIKNRLRDQVLKRKQEEVSILRRTQRCAYVANISTVLTQCPDLPHLGRRNQKWLQLETSIKNIALSKKQLIEQEVRMELFLEKRYNLGLELDIAEERRQQAVVNQLDLTQLDSYIDDIKENINYVQETITEIRHLIMELGEAKDNNDNITVQRVINNVLNVNEAKYLSLKLCKMALHYSQQSAQKDAKLKESDAIIKELEQENLFKGQLLDHILKYDLPIFSKELFSSISINVNTTARSDLSRSPSPVTHLRKKSADSSGI